MPVTDPIANYLVCIKNAITVKKEKQRIPASQMKLEITKILKEEGYIENFKYEEDGKQGFIVITLKYGPNNERLIREIKRISKPSKRVYCKYSKIPKIKRGLGICIISTSKGVITGEQARRLKIGGELLCYIW
ncbi:MAG: 30S ribosomal protein S8 [Candidatus Fischerbacteria bacterium RBG_13_37_8]|uniref:Small ribosomal subunit protein uS8 n=1 Tax=Candidatus Fischerbacteria bacterium RBG_13_37_8 TaxID=1817863 RepID=A0A1F5VE45_9BACT|nr:ribosomal protein S8 [uncultured bacterium]OGF61665.1 MAG: 30S ribosomal protein S8 [Candidatus Fischerbacteria bacterium RBG_13_37_8]